MKNHMQRSLIITVLVILLNLIKAGEIYSKITSFDYSPQKYFYFKNSDYILLHESQTNIVWYSADAGWSWYKSTGIPQDTPKVVIQHPFDNQVAYIVTNSQQLYVSRDYGKSWSSVDLPLDPATMDKRVLQFHSERSPYLIFIGKSCSNSKGYEVCHQNAYYSTDYGKGWIQFRTFVNQCQWGLSTYNAFVLPVQSIFCTEYENKDLNEPSRDSRDLRLVYSEDLFKSIKVITFENQQVTGVIGMGSVDKFLVVGIKTLNTQDLDLYVSVDGKVFNNAKFPLGTGIVEDAYTVLQSSSTSLIVDVFTSRGYNKEYGVLYRSDSEGRYFIKSLENTNRNTAGIVDYERVQGVEGIALANIVSNPEGLSGQFPEAKRIESRITFDDGASWRLLNPPQKDVDGKGFDCLTLGPSIPNDKCALHLHSVTSPHNPGRVFSDSAVPGVIMGVGNVGDYLLPYEKCDTFISTDGGIMWKMVRKGPYKFESADQGGLLVMISDNEYSSDVVYSTDFGQNWKVHTLDKKFKVKVITSDPESTSQKLILIASESSSNKYSIVSLDFRKLLDRACSADDFEWWRARGLGENDECLLGHYQDIQRRKANAQCYVGKNYKTPEVKITNCACTTENYECDYGFIIDKSDKNKCVEQFKRSIPFGACKDGATEYEDSAGYRKIPGDTCVGGINLVGKKKFSCQGADLSKNIQAYPFSYGSSLIEKIAFDKSQVILLRFADGSLFLSDDTGKDFKRVQIDGKATGEEIPVTSTFQHDTDNARIYVLVKNEKLFYSPNRATSFSELKLPSIPNQIGAPVLDFHPTERDWIIFVGGTKCPNCHSSLYVSTDNGASWSSELDSYVQKCVFSQDQDFKKIDKESIFCSAYNQKFGDQASFDGASKTPSGNVLSLYKYDKLGKSEKKILTDNVVQFYVYKQFLAVASMDSNRVKFQISEDGTSLVEALFPPETSIQKNAFTIVQSNSGSVFLDVQRNTNYGKEFGNLYSSNNNGTQYTLALENTNRNAVGFVDFEQNQSLDGALIANIVQNAPGVLQGDFKQVRTMISYDNGASWKNISEVYDSERKRLECSFSSCQLNLHGRTQVSWPGPIFSAKNSPGLLVGVGNYGPQLTDLSQSNTYISHDGGLTWDEIKKGAYFIEVGNSGGIIAMVSSTSPSNVLYYSIDDGKSWKEYKFHQQLVNVKSLEMFGDAKQSKFYIFGSTVESSVSSYSKSEGGLVNSIQNFLKSLFKRSSGQSVVAIQIDMTQAQPIACKFKEDGSGDYEKWNPKQSDCILGREFTYWRRKKNAGCRVQENDLPPNSVASERLCDCQRQDYECEVGFLRDASGNCVLKGVDPYEPASCRKGDQYQGKSGYRKIAATKCSGSVSSLEQSVERTCQGSNPGGVVIAPPTDGKIGVELQNFSEQIDKIIWFNKSMNAIIKTFEGQIWTTTNGGSNWQKSVIQEKVSKIVQNQYYSDRVYLVISNFEFMYVSTDASKTFTMIKLPAVPNTFGAPVLEFHAEEPEWIIFTGNVECPGQNCHTTAYVTQDNGLNWKQFASYVTDCEWARDAQFKSVDKQMVFCAQYTEQKGNMLTMSAMNSPQALYKSDDFFYSSSIIFQDLSGFAISENFMVVALVSKEQSSGLRFFVSMDGKRFAQAIFPPGFDAKNHGFTVLESASGSVFLDMFKQSSYGTEWGTLFISNQNGTYYSESMAGTNRNSEGYVDYEKMLGIDGVALLNQVVNKESVKIGDKKKIQSFMTFDEGQSWNLITAPKKTIDGSSISCYSSQNCSLHFHGYTERKRVKNEMSDESSVGIMIGVGNYGSQLNSYEQSNTYLTTDAGLTWNEVALGPHLFEFGDHGSVIVLVHSSDPTNFIWYSITQGASFEKFEFSSSTKIYADRFVTDPSGTKQTFLLIGKIVGSSGQTAVFKLDFSKLRSQQCILDKDNADKSDFELWTLSDASGNQCIFGHKSQYYRRKQGRNCFIGQNFNMQSISQDCDCVNADYECDAGFYRNLSDKKCVAVAGEGQQVWSECQNWSSYLSSGYKKRVKSTCKNGVVLHAPLDTKYCKMYSSSAVPILLGIFIPLCVVGALGFVYYRRKVAPYRYSIRLPTSENETQTRLNLNFGFVTKIFYGIGDIFHGIVTDLRARRGYRAVPLNENAEVHLDSY